MRSTYDRTGGNEGADASHFLYQQADDFNVALDVAGPGVLYFTRFNHWHGSPWHFEIDGADHILSESSTADPTHPVPGSAFLPPGLLPRPLAWTWADTRGADLSWVPMPFQRSLRLAYSRTHYGTGYYIFQRFTPGAQLSQPLHPWDGRTPPAADVLALLNRSGSDLAPRSCRRVSGQAAVPAGAVTLLAHLTGASVIRGLDLTISEDQAAGLSAARLRITWDGRPSPSVDAPVPLFFGAGTLYNRDHREYLVRSFPVSIRYAGGQIHLACYFPMPFFRSAQVDLVGGASRVSKVAWSVRTVPFHAAPEQVGYFHATYRDHPHPVPGEDLLLLDTRRAEGGGDWCGSLVGTSFIFSDRAVLGTLEGDPRFYFDDSQTPQAQGTGTEEWGGGGDYWGGRNMTLPFAGHPIGAPNAREAAGPEDEIESAYRFLLADLMPFGKNARICLEHGGTDDSTEHYQTVTYWYGLPGAALVQTDVLKMGDPASEAAHAYHSPDASPVYALTSRYERGVDHLNGKEIFPATTDTGRWTRGQSEFTLKLDPRNLGVLLRRKLDYSFPNQRAEVFIGSASGRTGWRSAGVWYTAGSNTCVYSNPKGELGAAQHIVETSNRRFRDDEFLLPRALTRGKRQIRVRVRFTPVRIPLFPGAPLPDLAWSEMRYTCYCCRMPPNPAKRLPTRQ